MDKILNTTKITVLSDVIRDRRTVYADQFINRAVPQEVIALILSGAIWAPTHKMTQPWRFIQLEGNHTSALGNFMAEYYKKVLSEEQFPIERYKATQQYANNATLIAIVMQRSQRIEIPEWEEIAAVACAVQNIWLSCTAHDVSGYWDTAPATHAYVETLALAPNETSMGIFYMGYTDSSLKLKPRKRKPLSKKFTKHRI